MSEHSTDEKVFIAGDWHGKTDWAKMTIDTAARSNISLILHLGDFGIWPSPKGQRYMAEVSRKAVRSEVDILITLGNHEAWDDIEKLWKLPKHCDHSGNPQPIQLLPRIWILPKAYSFSLNGVSFLSLGGAASVDYDNRTRGKNWWPQEMINLSDVELAVAMGEHDVLLTHEAPHYDYCAREVQHILDTNPRGYTQEGLDYSKISRSRVTEVMESCKPRFSFAGHMHVRGERKIQLPGAQHLTRVNALSQEKTDGNIFRFDLKRAKAEKSRSKMSAVRG